MPKNAAYSLIDLPADQSLSDESSHLLGHPVVHTLSFFVGRRRAWRFSFTRFPSFGDGWSRYALHIGPYFFSWSHARELM